LELDLHEAGHRLDVARQNLATARQRAELAERHAELGRRAYEQGEMDLMDLLRLQNSAVAAQRQLARLEVEVDRQTAAYNQAVGDIP
jgi:outer membrane protein TolC